MSKDKEPKQEILLPAKQPNRAVSPFAPQGPTDVVSSLTTGFKEDLRRSTNSKIARRIQSQMDMVEAQTELDDACERLHRGRARLLDIDATLDTDQAERDAARAEATDRREDEREKRGRQRELARKKYQQELHNADRDIFNAEQELKKQKMIAAAELGRSWAEAEGTKLDAVYVMNEARKQHAVSPSVSAPSIREMLDAEHDRLRAEGKHDEALLIKGAKEALEK